LPTNGPIMAPILGEVDRVLGRIRGPRPGPTLLAVAALHGNEPAGIIALRRVLDVLEGRETSVRGEFVALAGNRRALIQGRRYLHSDLNRAWKPNRIRGTGREDSIPPSEELERSELQESVDQVIAQARGPVFFLDLHTTSGPGIPFSAVMDSLASRRFAQSIPVPLVVGLGELVEGTLLGHLANRGIPGVVFEGGRHTDESSVDSSVAGIWLALSGAGVIQEGAATEVGSSRKLLLSSTLVLPPVFELRYRHPVSEGDGFRMHPGFRSFQPVSGGQLLAEDSEGGIEAPETGRLLMPLYQLQGEDGFFLVREFHPFWLNVSEVLRRLRVARILHWFPGIRRDRQSPDRLRVDKRLARWFSMEVLHLLGYRRTVETEDSVLVIRQQEPDP